MVKAFVISFLLVAGPLFAQRDKEPARPALEYAGSPLEVPVDCTNDDIAALGLVCPPDSPCAVFLELTSVAFIKGKLVAVGNLHSEGVTMFSVLLQSEDGGLTWTEPAERVLRGGLDRVHFHDEEHGWASGHILDGEPRDPFFLLTTDGGKFWRRRDVLTSGQTAEIQRFWFDSDRSGGLLIDRQRDTEAGARYARYETMTGAESWMIREVSTKPIRPRRRVTPPEAEWRVIPDGGAGAWQVQKRDTAGWVSVAEFQIEPGVCVAVEEVIAEAPPPPKPESRPEVAEPLDPSELPVAPGGVFVIGSGPPPVNPTQEVKTAPEEEEDKRPTLKKPKP